jgi:hypothetical protein
MSSFRLQGALFESVACRTLCLADCCRRLERNTKVDWGAVRDAALDAAGIIGFSG